ncbi:MAG: DNA polymerase/3'-5' exonuclease PolX [Chloroflexi bacterium]|nr:DNA polymerase/3'-5' exonuclease PolX [Chloroflexota bacterium]
MPYTNEMVARIFENMAGLLGLKGENAFKIRAYQRAARTIEQLPEPLEQMVREGKDLQAIPGIGEAISKKIVEMVTTGKMHTYEELKAEFPAGVLNLMDIPGVGPRTAWRIARELGVSTVEELEQAILAGKLAALPRMGEKSAENILRHIRALRSKERRIPLGKALPVAEEVIAALRERCPSVRQAVPVGSLRRWRETVGDIDLMAVAPDPQAVVDALAHLPMVVEVLAAGPKKGSVVVSAGLQVDLRIVDEESFGAMLQYFTGSKQHNILLRDYANHMGLSLSEYGITDLKTEKLEKFSDEESFYALLGLQWVPPELREGVWEVELAARHALPRLVELSDIKGDLHVHSDWSDGRDPLEAMLAAANARGYQYVALTDHSAGRGIAHGLTVERLRQQRALLQQVRAANGLRVLHGSEVDIRADGALDFPDDVLGELDVVVASVHSALGQERERMTQRIIAAMRNPHVDIIGHLTCRLLGEREPVDVDLEALFQVARETGVALEVNAGPERLDIKDTHILRAKELGVPLVISTDAHRTEALANMRFGVAQARRAWCEAAHILNTRPFEEILSWLNRQR